MMAPVCNRFIQNAWKKDMCSNCFRSKVEHSPPENVTTIKKTLINAPVKSIIKTPTKPKHKKRNVSFSQDPVLVIGHGGEEWSDDEGVPDDLSSGSSGDDYTINDEDKEIEKITKYNTDYNTNLLTNNSAEKRRTFTQLMLGKPQTDAEGNKQTLLVSVTPFGQEDTPKKNCRSHIPIAKPKENDNKPNVILTAYIRNKRDTNTNKLNSDDTIDNKVIENNFTNTIGTKSSNDIQNDSVAIRNEKNMDIQQADEVNINSCEILDQGQDPVLQEINVEDKINQNGNNYEELNNENSDCVDSAADMSMSSSEYYETLDVKNNENDRIISTINCELVKSRTELTIQLVAASNENMPERTKDSADSSDDCEFLTPVPHESREQAGEPDGRADPDVVNEPPALPLTPPPLLNPRVSFLHGSPKNSVRCKPIVPTKPEKIMQLFKKNSELPPSSSIAYINDPNKTPNKRRAPNPPPSPILEPIPNMVRCLSLPDNIPPKSEKCEIQTMPEPAPRKILSTSHENILLEVEKADDKRKEKSRSKFSLKKLLRVGASAKSLDDKKKEKESDQAKIKVPQVRPRLVIVHPLDLNGPIVEVVRQDAIKIEDVPPAPPPRNIPPERVAADIKQISPPPKSEQLIKKQNQLHQQTSASGKPANGDIAYANIGEVRSALAPSKPQRTASMREREAREEQRKRVVQSQYDKEHVYERIVTRHVPDDQPSERSRYKSTSLPAYSTGSEADSELMIYSPCSYYGSECDVSETVSNGEGDWSARPCRLRCRKGRAVLHKNLEDNYGAVVIANREALAQVLDNLHGCPIIAPALRGLQTLTIVRWADFAVVDVSAGVIVGKRTFYHALWGAHHVTLALSRHQSCLVYKPTLGLFPLTPITEFSDLVPASLLQSTDNMDAGEDFIQASISVLPWMHIDTIHSFGSEVKARFALGQSEEIERDISSILLQLINGLKSLQAQGTEEMPLSLNNLILCREVDRDIHHRLCILQGLNDGIRLNSEESSGSLCQCALTVLDKLLPTHSLAVLLRCLLRKESAMSLSQVKSVLEFYLWGPIDVTLGMPIKDRELVLQRWLDLERATVLHGLVGTRVQLSVLEECHLLFLVRSSAKMMFEAALLLESNGVS